MNSHRRVEDEVGGGDLWPELPDQDSPEVPEAAIETVKKTFEQNAARCREKAADKHPGVGNICTTEAVTWEAALAALDALDSKEQREPKATRRASRGGEIREVMTQGGLVEMIPVSALLSDEVVAQAAKAGRPMWQAYKAAEKDRAFRQTRAALQAAIKQVGGAK